MQGLRLALSIGAKRIAGYVATDGEVDISPLLAELAARGHEVHLPRISERGHDMAFIRWHPDNALRRNRYAIPEPVFGGRCPAAQLDLVFVPLLACDRQGNRLGSGAGYYDRCFAFRGTGTTGKKAAQRPLLCGVGYPFQLHDALQADPWDVPLDCALIGSQLIAFRN